MSNVVVLWVAMLTAAAGFAEAADGRLYEMRIYEARPGKLDALQARFREHTTKLFAKHGMTNVGYFVPAGDNPGRRLVYFLSYPDRAARDASWRAFLADPDWLAARTASEEKAGGSLTEKDGGVVSEFLVPTDYSPLR